MPPSDVTVPVTKLDEGVAGNFQTGSAIFDAAKPLAGVVVAISLLTVGCGKEVSVSTDGGQASVSAGPLIVDKQQLSAEVEAQLTKKLGTQASPVTCPEDLEPDIGATTTCSMSAPDGTYAVTVTVTKVDWTGFGNFGVGNAIFDAKVADKPNP